MDHQFDFDAPTNEVGPAPREMLSVRTGLRAVSGSCSWPIRRLWAGGFALRPGDRIRGFVDIYDGDQHLFSCLATATVIEGDEQLFRIERRNGRSPAPCDYAQDASAPSGALAAFEASRIGL